eukprot:COSAG05_NODE_733_length_7644_cov_43.682704_1_plen_127_part_00
MAPSGLFSRPRAYADTIIYGCEAVKLSGAVLACAFGCARPEDEAGDRQPPMDDETAGGEAPRTDADVFLEVHRDAGKSLPEGWEQVDEVEEMTIVRVARHCVRSRGERIRCELRRRMSGVWCVRRK